MQPEDSIHVHTLTQAVRARRKLCRAIFGTPHCPRELPTATNNQPSPVPNMPTGTRLSLPGCADAFRWVPSNWNGVLVIVHQGHGLGLVGIGVDTLITELHAAGYAVVGCVMPPEPHDGIPLSTFLWPVHAAITHAFATLPGLKRVCMTGISGGGWTTTLCAAIDWRIRASIPTAGSLPLYMAGDRDAEQLLPGLEPLTYLDLYAMAGLHPRTSTQVLHSQDVCCFNNSWLSTGPDYVPAVQAVAPGFSRVMLQQTEHAYLSAGRSVVQTEVAL